MNTLEKTFKKKTKYKIVTDRYEECIRWTDDDDIVETIWESWPYVGPGAYDCASVDKMMSRKNDVYMIRRGPETEKIRTGLSFSKVIFEP